MQAPVKWKHNIWEERVQKSSSGRFGQSFANGHNSNSNQLQICLPWWKMKWHVTILCVLLRAKTLIGCKGFFFSRKVVLDWMAEEDGKLANCPAATALSCLDTEMIGWTQRGPNILYIIYWRNIPAFWWYFVLNNECKCKVFWMTLRVFS